ncbi:A24 family peptidase C-terminal domain-containing protein [Candidatus Nitrosotenuis sp. DW1]|uniref:A24 family peptidase C-terminal domain-containing protein n=1 Tax=Candidatus Nitrosotenuis sp. DW1 TaxID=2259672 RepID=UPI002105B575|nr:A24 family peptidase C-terminal domain-containing protein [Candidatus Nitrosotenuis sp. DW1]
MVFGALGTGIVLLGTDLSQELPKIGISLIIAPFVLLIWRIGLFGGADAFALIVLAVLAPSITITGNVITPFTTLTNAVLMSVAPMIINVTRNTILLATKKNIFEGFDEPAKKKIVAMFVGYRAANPKFSFSIERKVGNQKKLNLALQHAENAAFCKKSDTWVTPGIPYMIFITAGFIVQLVYGDFVMSIFGDFL